MKTGAVVKLGIGTLDNKAGTIGVCYDEYDLGYPGNSVIFENGNNASFPSEGKEVFLKEIGFCKEVSGYIFYNVTQLIHDFDMGVFDPVFKDKSYE